MKSQLTTTSVAAAIAACALIAPAAQAAVSTYALSGDGTNQAVAGYNVDTQDYQNYYQAPVGAKRWGGCLVAGVQGCSASWDGTTTTSPNATASFDRTTYAADAYGVPSSGSAYARADLTTGQLGVSVDGTKRISFGQNTGILGRGSAIFSDGLNFSVAGAGATTTTDIGIVVDLHGVFQNPEGGSSLRNQLRFGDGYFLTQDGLGFGPNTHQASGWVSYSFAPDTNNEVLFSGVYALTGASQHIDIWEEMFTQSGAGNSTDFARTSDFSFVLPSNVTFTSDSGAFLTGLGAPAGVPEPAAWALMIAGFGGIGALARRRRSAPATA